MIGSICYRSPTLRPFVQWVVTGYLVALAVSLPAAGWLGSRYGYGRIWAAALAAFVVGSVLCAIAPGLLTLIGARFLQGLAGGLMVPAGQAVIGSAADRDQLGRLMGTLGLVVVLGPAVGPAIGGVLLEVASWRWLFWINVPIGIAALVAARGVVPAGSTPSDRPLDRTGPRPAYHHSSRVNPRHPGRRAGLGADACDDRGLCLGQC
jgi:MFS family permease